MAMTKILFMATMFLTIAFLIISTIPAKAYADVFPERRVIHLTREAVID